MKIKACIFDLDGVVVDTAKYHYLAWKKLAKELGFDFSQEDNEALKGISRMQSLDILLKIGSIKLPESKKQELAYIKNSWYREYLKQMTIADMIPGVEIFLKDIKNRKIPTALASASKNANMVLEILDLSRFFDAVVDVTKIKNVKPDPELFQKAAEMLNVKEDQCCVFEDAEAGITGAKAAGMYAVGIGLENILKEADLVIPDFTGFKFENLP